MSEPDLFGALATRVIAALPRLPVVTPEQYRAIECNRCGYCCEDIRGELRPAEMAAQVTDDRTDGERRRFLSGLEPVGQVAGGWRYRCRHFARDADGLGLCTIHATRPEVCRGFPFGRVVRAWPSCAWNVIVRGADGTLLNVVPESII